MSESDRDAAISALALLNPRLTYHRASVEHVERIPAIGGAVIVSNHGRLDLDSFILLRLLLRSRGRLARLMADHMWFMLPLTRGIFTRAGAVDGTRENAVRLLGDGELVLSYPGGVREIIGVASRMSTGLRRASWVLARCSPQRRACHPRRWCGRQQRLDLPVERSTPRHTDVPGDTQTRTRLRRLSQPAGSWAAAPPVAHVDGYCDATPLQAHLLRGRASQAAAAPAGRVRAAMGISVRR